MVELRVDPADQGFEGAVGHSGEAQDAGDGFALLVFAATSAVGVRQAQPEGRRD